LGKGNAWCAAFIYWTFVECGFDPKIANPAWSPSWFVSNVIYSRNQKMEDGSQNPECGDVFGIWFESKGRIAHVGFIDEWKQDSKYCITVEGNTNEAGSRDGDGVYRKRRLKGQIYKISRWR